MKRIIQFDQVEFNSRDSRLFNIWKVKPTNHNIQTKEEPFQHRLLQYMRLTRSKHHVLGIQRLSQPAPEQKAKHVTTAQALACTRGVPGAQPGKQVSGFVNGKAVYMKNPKQSILLKVEWVEQNHKTQDKGAQD